MSSGRSALTPDNRGFAYADGFFTTMAVSEGQILWRDYHQKRLITHARALQLSVPIEALLAQIQAGAVMLGEGVMKLVITRAPQAVRGYGFSNNAAGQASMVWLKSTPMALASAKLTLPNDQWVWQQPATDAICLTSQIACLPPSLAGLKTLNRLDGVLASGELQAIRESGRYQDQLGEGLVRDMTGCWVEGTMSNVFYQLASPKSSSNSNSNQAHPIQDKPIQDKSKRLEDDLSALTHGQWFTPPMTQSGVAGIMRAVIIDALAATEHPVVERPLMDSDLPQLSRLFYCNAVRGVMPARRLRLLSADQKQQ